MRRFRPTLVAGAIALAFVAGSASAQFSGVYTFGDSLSDAGQYGSRFTTNPGLTASMYVGQTFGLTSTPSFTGGNDYAQGGALINAPQGGLPPGTPDLSVAAQVNQFLAKGPLDRNALYQIQGGGNDLFTQFTLFATGQISQAQLQGAIAQAGVDLATQAGKLKAAGAQYVIVQSVPDAGKAPAAAPFGPQAQAALTALSGLFNSSLNGAISQAGLQVIQFNTFAFLNELGSNPSLYGFVNATSAACTTASSFNCSPSTLVAPNANLNYVFADGKHATTGSYLALTQAIVSMITGPQQMAALAEAPRAIERANWRALDSRMMSSINAPGGPQKLQAWATYDYARDDISGTGLSGKGDVNTITVGGDMRVTDRILAGLAFGYSEYKGDFGSSNGDFKVREPMVTAYMGYGEGPWYVGATLGLGSLDVSTTRNIVLGAATRTESGTTKGYQNTVRVLGGYWLKYQNWDHGPFAKVTWDKIIVRQFSENGNDSTTLNFGQQKNEAVISSLGWQIAGNINGWRPFARATWEHNFDNNYRQVSATPVGLSGTYVVPGYQQDNNWALFDLGISRDFGKVTGFISGNASAGKNDGDSWAITLGVRVPL